MGVARDVLMHPRRVWLRRAVFQVHLWAGVLISVYLVVIALSGSLLVYKDALLRWTLPGGALRLDGGGGASPEVVVRRFEGVVPGGALSTLQVPTPVLGEYLLTGKDGAGRPGRWVVDATTGAVLAAPRTWVDTVHDLHYYLLLPETWGMQANGVGAAVLLLLAVTGLLLWWPGVRVWTRGLRVNLRANWRRVNYDVHNAIGFWTLAIVVWWAVSGVYFGWYRQVTAVVAAVSPLRGMRAPGMGALPPVMPGTRASLGDVVRAAEAVSPGGRLWSVSDPQLRGAESFVLLDRGAAGDFSHRDIARVRVADARVESVWHYGERHSAGDWVLWSMHPLHFGTVWGPWVKAVWAALGVSLAVLTVTGLLMYWNRWLRHRWRALR